MEYADLIAAVRTRAGLSTPEEARQAVEATARALAHLLGDDARRRLAEALPGRLRPAAEESQAGRRDLSDFLQEVAYFAEVSEEQARYRAQATLSALAAADRDLGQLIAGSLPDAFDELLAPAQIGGGVVAATGGPAPLGEGELARILRVDLVDWTGSTEALRRTISLPPENLHALVARVRGLAPKLSSGPEIDLRDDTATITLRTRSVSAVTPDDVDLARRIDDLIDEVGPSIG